MSPLRWDEDDGWYLAEVVEVQASGVNVLFTEYGNQAFCRFFYGAISKYLTQIMPQISIHITVSSGPYIVAKFA